MLLREDSQPGSRGGLAGARLLLSDRPGRPAATCPSGLMLLEIAYPRAFPISSIFPFIASLFDCHCLDMN